MTFDQQQYLSWWIYVGPSILYTGFVFRDELPGKKGLILSKHNARPLSAILAIHIEFIAILLAAIWAAVSYYPVLPDWLTNTVSMKGSPTPILVIIFAFAGVIMHFIERRWLSIEAETAPPECENIPS